MLFYAKGPGPLYHQIYRALRGRILSGRLTPGSRLPSTRALGAELGVSRTTLLLAYGQLLAEGYVEGRTGSGTFVAAALPEPVPAPPRAGKRGRAPARATPHLSKFGRRIVAKPPRPSPSTAWRGRPIRYDFRYGISGADPPPWRLWRRLTMQRLRGAAPESFAYAPPEGAASLREALARYLERTRAVACKPEQIIIVNGSQQALDLAARVLLDPGDRVVLEEPHSQGAREVFLAAGARLVPSPVDAEGLNVAALRPAARRARLVYVTPSHQFPTGAVMSLARRLALLAWAHTAGAYILEHDYDGEFRFGGRPIEAVAALDRHGRVIYVGTFSRVLFPTLRVGYMVLPEPLGAAFRAAKWLTDRHTGTFPQEVLAAFIAGGHFERALRRSRTVYAKRRAALLAAAGTYLAGRVDITGTDAGTHVLMWFRRIPVGGLPALVERAASAGVGVYPATRYFLRPPRRAGVLLGYGAIPDGDIEEGIRRLAAVLP